MKKKIRIFATPQELANHFAEDFARWVEASSPDSSSLTVALSGGSTPKLLFRIVGNELNSKIDWSRVHLFWGDERCVPPTDPESNFGVANDLWLNKVRIASENVHRVHGESDARNEQHRYASEIKRALISNEDGIPVFDLVILGMGADGHTASIFPDSMELLETDRTCAIARHPETGQLRITITGRVINAAKRIVFLITGADKANVLRQVIHHTEAFESFPASHIDGGQVEFFLDQSAASQLDQIYSNDCDCGS